MSATNIEWTDRVWNPVTGCQKVSPGCKNCYAEGIANRFWKTQYAPVPVSPLPDAVLASGAISATDKQMLEDVAGARPRRFTDVLCHPERLADPRSWRKPSRVFVNSMSDLFHKDVPDSFIFDVFEVMERAKQHTFQVLTKRPDRMLDVLGGSSGTGLSAPALPNVWLGVSVEDQERANERIPLLLQTPAVVRFISAEPLLGEINLKAVPIPTPGAAFYGLTGVAQPLTEKDSEPDDWKYWTRHAAKLNWVIVGGESGSGARPLNVRWIRSITAQCEDAGIPVFVKQLGAQWFDPDRRRSKRGAVIVPVDATWTWVDGGDRKGGDPSEWPTDLRVREFPQATGVER